MRLNLLMDKIIGQQAAFECDAQHECHVLALFNAECQMNMS